MTAFAFLKDRLIPIAVQSMAASLAVAAIAIVSRNAAFAASIGAVLGAGIVVALVVEYLPRRAYYGELLETVEMLDRKNLLIEVVDAPDFEEGRIAHDLLRIANKAMLEEIAAYRRREKEYRDYIELWVHEIKTPIASAKLVGRNNPSASTGDMLAEVERVEDLVEQTLFYSRSNTVEKDFIVRKVDLASIVNPAVRRNARQFIERRIRLDIGDLSLAVWTDVKWASFIVHQVLANAVTYADTDDPVVRIEAKEGEQSVRLTIADNGCGILASELPRVFDKGFTGTNGRRNVASTGLGLYLVRKLAERIAIGVSIDSSVGGEGTTVTLVFPVLATGVALEGLTRM